MLLGPSWLSACPGRVTTTPSSCVPASHASTWPWDGALNKTGDLGSASWWSLRNPASQPVCLGSQPGLQSPLMIAGVRYMGKWWALPFPWNAFRSTVSRTFWGGWGYGLSPRKGLPCDRPAAARCPQASLAEAGTPGRQGPCQALCSGRQDVPVQGGVTRLGCLPPCHQELPFSVTTAERYQASPVRDGLLSALWLIPPRPCGWQEPQEWPLLCPPTTWRWGSPPLLTP